MVSKQIIYLLVLLIQISLTAQNMIQITPVENPIALDGKMELEWNNSDSISNFIQLEPSKGKLSTRTTVVKAIQHNQRLYFLFKCYVNHRNEISSRIQRRDRLDQSDDIISILLDTYQDNRTALLFQVNAIGTLTDAKINDDGKVIDYLWDTEWEAKTSISNDYWICEIEIPLKSISYKSGLSDWGINFSRIIRTNQETVWWQPVSENYRVSQNGKISSINSEMQKYHSFEVFPYTTLRYENSDLTEKYNKYIGDGGIDFQYKYSSNLKVNATINPDFATIEGDREIINLTPWEIRFPEKRLFFQDGNEMFNTRIQTFYSRRIGDMKFGGKAIGKIGKYQFNGIFARTKKNSESNHPEANFTAFKIKRDILKSSSIGFTYTDKITDASTFRTFSLDYILNLGETWKLTGQFVGSTPGDLKSHSAWYIRFARENNIYHYHIRYSNFGKNFNNNINKTGFFVDDDRKEMDADLTYRLWINSTIKYVYLLSKNNLYWSQSGTPRSRVFLGTGRVYLENNFSLDVNYKNEYKLFDKDYHNHYYLFKLGYKTDESSNAAVSYRFGKNYDLDFALIEFSTKFNLSQKLSLNYEFNHLDYKPDPNLESTNLNILGIDYFFDKDIWIRIFSQTNSNDDRFYLYGLFGWRFKPPFGAVYLIMNFDKYQQILAHSSIKSEIVFLKFTYPISIL